jgi:hypothetical protein
MKKVMLSTVLFLFVFGICSCFAEEYVGKYEKENVAIVSVKVVDDVNDIIRARIKVYFGNDSTKDKDYLLLSFLFKRSTREPYEEFYEDYTNGIMDRHSDVGHLYKRGEDKEFDFFCDKAIEVLDKRGE